jgi:hypothetical protein
LPIIVFQTFALVGFIAITLIQSFEKASQSIWIGGSLMFFDI